MASKRSVSFKIGITGNLCTGKSLVRNVLHRQGISTLDPQDVVLTMLANNPQHLSIRLTDHFGPDILDNRGRLLRKKLAGAFLMDPEKKVFFEEKLRPIIRQEIKRFLFSPMGTYIRAVEHSALLENDTQHLYDEVWMVTTPTDIQAQRIIDRDKISVAEANYMIDSQWPQDKKASMCNRVIDNSETIHQTETQVRKVLDEISLRVFKVGI